MSGNCLIIIYAVVSTILLSIFECHGASLSDSSLLLNDLFANYSKDLRPVANQSETLNVTVGMFVFSINDFDDVTGELSFVAAPYVFWTDYRLTWTPSDYGGLTQLTVPQTKLWIPNVFLLDPSNKMEALGDEDFLGRVSSTGITSWAPGGLIKTTCDVDMSNFPLDTQTCGLTLTAWGYMPTEVYLIPFQSTIDFTYFTKNSLWNVIGSSAREHAIENAKGFVRFEVTLKRKPLYFIINMIAPIFLLCCLNPLVFVLPVESGERVSYSITIFLSFAVFMTILSDSLPKTSEPMAFISYFLISAMLASTASCVLAIFTMQLHFENKETPVSNRAATLLNILTFQYVLKLCRTRNNKTSQSISKNSNFVNVKPKDGNTWENSATTDLDSKEQESSDDQMTWKAVALSYDKTLFWYFVVFTIIQWIVFAIVLTT